MGCFVQGYSRLAFNFEGAVKFAYLTLHGLHYMRSVTLRSHGGYREMLA